MLESHRPPYGYAWSLYPSFVRCAGAVMGMKSDEEFRQKGVKIGTLPPELLLRLREAIDRAQPCPIEVHDHDQGYFFHAGIGQYAKALNRDHFYVQGGSDQAAALVPIIELFRRPVSACLSSPWHVVNTRCWKTRPGASEGGPNAWHTDGFPLAAPKLMIYVTGAGADIGTTEIKTLDGETIRVEGPPGTWVLFRNGDLLHRGVAPRVGERIILELTLSPTLRFDPHPVFAGLNAQFPRRPWYRSSNTTGHAFTLTEE